MRTTITTLAIFAAGLSFGQDRNRPPKNRPTTEQLIADLDTDKDGLISVTEAKGPLKDDFLKLDINQDGFLSKKEIDNAPKPKTPPSQGGRPQK